MGLDLLVPQAKCSSFEDLVYSDTKLDFDSVEELIDYRIDDFDIGYAALSSIVSLCRDPEPNLVQHRQSLNRFLMAARQTYEQTIDYLSNNRVDRVYVFNGRFAAMRAVLRACQRQNVDCYLHERGCDGEHYELFKNHLPHDLQAIETAINDLWQAAESNANRNQIAAQWFHDRVNRVEKVWHSFVKNQQSGRLPQGWDDRKKNISIYCSSDDEFVAIGDAWRNNLYPNQVHAISRIATDLHVAQPDTRLYLRVHPNLTQVDNSRKREMLAMEHPNLRIIAPDANIDSYELMRSSDTVVSFGSSVGCESVFWGKPSVLLGPSFYQNLGGVYRPSSHAETIELLSQTLSPLSMSGALKYGFWLQTRGHRHKYFEHSGLFDGKFKNQTLYARESDSPSTIFRIKRHARRIVANWMPAFAKSDST